MITLLLRQTGAALRMLLVLTVLLGLVYPLAVWGVARIPGLTAHAEGSVVAPDGSRRVLADRGRPGGRRTRPPTRTSTPALGVGEGRRSGPATRPPPAARTRAGSTRSCSPRSSSGGTRSPPARASRPSQVPADAVTASASGLDPHISPAYAELQVAAGRPGDRAARATRSRSWSPTRPTARCSGFLGEPGGERHPAQPRRRGGQALTRDDSGADDAAVGTPRRAADLPRGGAGRRQDLRHARRGAPPAPTAAPTSSSAWSRPTAGRKTAALLEGLEVVPRRAARRTAASTSTELDVDAVLARAPEVVLVDELAHTNAPGSRNTKRWQDVEELLDAGIDVLSTVNVQHLESLNDVVERITGVAPAGDRARRGGAPRRADRAGRHHPGGAAAADGARQRLPGPRRSTRRWPTTSSRGNLTALREMALLWVADQVDVALQRYRSRPADHRHLGDPRAGRRRADRRPGERDACCGGPPASPSGPVGRAARRARPARRRPGRGPGRRTGRAAPARRRRRRLLPHRGRRRRARPRCWTSPAASNATQLVLGTSRRSRLARAVRRGHRRPRRPGLRADRRAHGHPPRGRPRASGSRGCSAQSRRPPAPPGGRWACCCRRWPPSDRGAAAAT